MTNIKIEAVIIYHEKIKTNGGWLTGKEGKNNKRNIENLRALRKQETLKTGDTLLDK